MAKKKRRGIIGNGLYEAFKSWREWREEQDADEEDYDLDEDDYEDDYDDTDEADDDKSNDSEEASEGEEEKTNSPENNGAADAENFDDMYGENHKTRTSLDDFERDDWVDGINVSGLLVAVGALALVGFGGYSVSKLFKKGNIKPEEETTEITTEAPTEAIEVVVEPTTEATTEEEKPDINIYTDMKDLLDNANISEEKKTAISKVWNYVSYYNTTVANQHMEENNSAKLAISWDEAMAQYLIYNKSVQDPTIISSIFDTYKLSAEGLKTDFENSRQLDYEAYHILNQETNKDSLFDADGANLYNRYEDIIIKFNSTKSTDTVLRKDLVERFYSDIRGNYNLSGNSSYNDPYKMQIIPMANLMLEYAKGIETSKKLNKHEKERLNEVDNVDDIINTICLYNVDTYTEDEFSYEDIRAFAIQQLINMDAYNLENRNVTTYTKYNLDATEEEVVEEETTEVTTEKAKNKGTKKKKKAKSTETTTQETLDDDDKSDTIPDWMLEDTTEAKKKTKKKKQETNTTTETDNNSYIDEDVPEVQPDTPDVSYNNRIINSTMANISEDMKQAYFNAVATAIVENMANSKDTSIEKAYVKSL